MNLEEIILVPHSHTDIGFTHDQPIVWELHGQFLEAAMDLCDREPGPPTGESFCWTVEVSRILGPWLDRAQPDRIAQFQRLCHAGRIEVAGMPLHLTPLADEQEIREALDWTIQLGARLGFPVRSVMHSDINGQNWPIVEAMLDAGIEGFSMAINTHMGHIPQPRPSLFMWEGHSGRRIPAYNGPPYGFPSKLGIGDLDLGKFRDHWLPRLVQQLQDNDYPAPVILLQCIANFGDNGAPDGKIVDYVRRWNAEKEGPRLTIGTLSTFWDRVAPFRDQLPVLRGDWSDAWNFGCLSRARELAIHRKTRTRIRSTRELLRRLPQAFEARSHIERVLELARLNTELYSEHTWGSDYTVSLPFNEDSWVMSLHKSKLVADARSASVFAEREVLAQAVKQLDPPDDAALVVFNPLPFERTVTGMVPGGVSFARGGEDDSASRHFQDRHRDTELTWLNRAPENFWHQSPEFMLRPCDLPPNGHVVLNRDQAFFSPFDGMTETQDAVVSLGHSILECDLERGGLKSWQFGGRELVDQDAHWSFGGYVHERVITSAENPRAALFEMDWGSPEFEIPDGWHTNWVAERHGANRVAMHRVRSMQHGTEIQQIIEVPGAASDLQLTIFAPIFADWIEFRAHWLCGLDPHPQSQYLVFPFALDRPRTWVDVSIPIEPEKDQLPGVQRDYYTCQNTVEFWGPEGGVMVALPENPMVQLGGFHFGRSVNPLRIERAHLMGWVTSNYWETNFPPVQPGRVTARYRVAPYRGGYDAERTRRFGLDAAYDVPLMHYGPARS